MNPLASTFAPACSANTAKENLQPNVVVHLGKEARVLSLKPAPVQVPQTPREKLAAVEQQYGRTLGELRRFRQLRAENQQARRAGLRPQEEIAWDARALDLALAIEGHTFLLVRLLSAFETIQEAWPEADRANAPVFSQELPSGRRPAW